MLKQRQVLLLYPSLCLTVIGQQDYPSQHVAMRNRRECDIFIYLQIQVYYCLAFPLDLNYIWVNWDTEDVRYSRYY